MSTALQQPRHWLRPFATPLNTRPAGSVSILTGEGASYVVLFPNSQAMGRRVTANQNSTGWAMFACPWADAATFEADALGFSQYISGQKYLKRRTPLRHGDPAQRTLFLDSLETISFHNFLKEYNEACSTTDGPYSLGWPKTEMVAYKGTFSQRHYPVYEDSVVSGGGTPELLRHLVKHSETEAYHRKVPGHGFAFESDVTKTCTVLASLPEYCVRWIYTTYFWPYPDSIPEEYVARTLGTVNSTAFDIDQKLTLDNGSVISGFPIETLKYEDFRKSQPYYGADEKQYVDLQHVFLYNPRNWNKQLNPATNAYEYIKQKDASNAFYSPARYSFEKREFHKLFWPRGAS